MDRHLARLCRACGIVTRYRAPDGETRRLGADSAVAVLAAMGVRADSAVAVREALERHDERRWRRVLPPVRVGRVGDPIRVLLTLPAPRARRAVAWVLGEEGGAEHKGILRPAELGTGAEARVGRRRVRRYGLTLPLDLPAGYHRLSVEWGGEAVAECRVVVAPPVCYLPEALGDGGRVWGPAAVLAALRSARNWGIGDFTDLTRVIELWAGLGAGVVEVAPLHALFPADPERVDPHAPSSRLFLNSLHLDPEAIPDFAECRAAVELVRSPAFQAGLRALRTAELVRYTDVHATKRRALELVYRSFRERHLGPGTHRGAAFRTYQTDGGEALWHQAVYEALAEHLTGDSTPSLHWAEWPAPYRDPTTPEVAAFAAANLDRVEFFQYLQWQSEQQFGAAGRRSWELGLGVGICAELAPGPAHGGAETWASRGVYATGARVGAPPDARDPAGQAWPIAPPIPWRLREDGYAAWAAVLRRNMQAAGALRVDRFAALRALLWVPDGASPAEGAWVRYPFADLLGVLALESERNRCVVIGEGVGSLPARMQEILTRRRILSYRLFCLEQDAHGDFRPSTDLPAQSLATFTTPPLPPLAAYWQGLDLDLCASFGPEGSGRVRGDQVVARAKDRARLLVALEREGLLPAGATVHPVSVPQATPALARAVYQYLGRSAAKLVTTRLADVFGPTAQTAPPAGGEQPSPWRERLALDLEDWGEDERVWRMAEALRQERGSAAIPRASPEPPPGSLLVGAAVPRATYRLQLHSGFTFDDASARVPYLAALGVSHCYLSPILRARPGSTHGYDIVDHGTINPELGGEAGLERLAANLRDHGMGIVLDVVPNHMGVMGADNAWWLDALENGPAGAGASCFDIDWTPVKDALRGKVLLPTLGDHYGNILDRGELRLAFDPDHGGFSIRYYEHVLPIDPREYPLILAPGIGRLEARLGVGHPQLLELASLVTAFGHLPDRGQTGPEDRAERHRDKEIHKRLLARLYREGPDVAWYVEECLREYNGSEGYPANPERLHQLLEAQAYRPAFWRVAADDINYRRFFDINDLASLRMERQEVFASSHRLVLDLVRRGLVGGLRIDHPDGLYDPGEYFRRLQSAATGLLMEGDRGEAGPRPPLWIVVEKVLAPHERLRATWPVHGTTGYDFASLCGGLLVDARAGTALDRTYSWYLGERLDADELVYQSKKLIMRSALASELNVLANQLSRIAEADRHTRDYTLNSLRSALAEVVACFPVYRTYVTGEGASPDDVRHVEWAIGVAKKRNSPADTSVFDFVRDVLLLRVADGKPAEYRQDVTAFALKFQQYTAPVQAKGLEDTAFYRYNRLTSLNEVGGDPRNFGVSAASFHRATQERARHWAHAMLCTSTHDSKRSEDVRARIHALSELHREWRAHLQHWRSVTRAKRSLVDGAPAPSRNDEYLLYQTLIGAWPAGEGDAADLAGFRVRIQRYMQKAVREAKVHSSWINPNADYEAAVDRFVESLLDRPEKNLFLADFLPFQRLVARLGTLNSLTQTILKLTVPGVPDIYQGSELVDLSLVDPDNRRPVDWEARARALAQAEQLGREPGTSRAMAVRDLFAQAEDGRLKLYLVHQCLGLRRLLPDLFTFGSYRPLVAVGAREAQVVAFERRHGAASLVVVVGRLFADLTAAGTRPPLGDVWGDTVVEVPATAGELRNTLTGERVRAVRRGGQQFVGLGEVFASLPVALLTPT